MKVTTENSVSETDYGNEKEVIDTIFLDQQEDIELMLNYKEANLVDVTKENSGYLVH